MTTSAERQKAETEIANRVNDQVFLGAWDLNEVRDIVRLTFQAAHDAGYAVVPREPTPNMIEAGWEACDDPDNAEAQWFSAMIAAADIARADPDTGGDDA